MGDRFTLVTYRKNRPKGIPVLFKPVDVSRSFWKVNPNDVARDVWTAAQEAIPHHRINKDGSLCVFVKSEGAVSNLLALEFVAGIAVSVSIPSSYVSNMGKIYDVPLDYDNGDLALYLEREGVISARRQVRHVYHEDGTDSYIPLRSVILTFKPTLKLPDKVHLGFGTHDVYEYVDGPVQCYNCQRFGHLARNCRWPTRCKICSGSHTLQDCTARREPKCSNCGGPHAASHSLCPRKRSAIQRFQTDVLPSVGRPVVSSSNDAPVETAPCKQQTTAAAKSRKRKRRPGRTQRSLNRNQEPMLELDARTPLPSSSPLRESYTVN
ncbi:uncharacterized protein LOC135385122 [Ornithodoros turicata]|uniref:uncharacterized protein LOC135385122 n=1 Tax=Ornithodoros turicata TaxID=34597 RepID=UPI0031389795